jgi:hypothetical protein
MFKKSFQFISNQFNILMIKIKKKKEREKKNKFIFFKDVKLRDICVLE